MQINFSECGEPDRSTSEETDSTDNIVLKFCGPLSPLLSRRPEMEATETENRGVPVGESTFVLTYHVFDHKLFLITSCMGERSLSHLHMVVCKTNSNNTCTFIFSP